jgi:hypothetical protein
MSTTTYPDTTLWPTQTYCNLMSSVHEVSERMLHRVQELAKRFPDEPLQEALEPFPVEPCEVRTTPRYVEPFRVSVSLPHVATAPADFLVLNHSRDGIGLLSPAPIEVGTLLHIRSAQAAPEAVWVPVQVRHCQPSAEGWVVGCEFIGPQLVREEE